MAGTTPVLISIPHAGTELPDALRARLTDDALELPDTDWHVHLLYDFAAELGVSMLKARYSRYVIDLNRDPEGRALYPGANNTELVPTTTFARAAIYRQGQAPSADEIARRADEFWQPYHRRLAVEIDAIRRRHGLAVIWDAHSIASRLPRFFDGRLPDLNLGTADGISADGGLVERVRGVLAGAKTFNHVVDGRFKGGYITRRYGAPAQGVHALQMELAQVAYMDESPPFAYRGERAALLQPVLRRCVETLIAWVVEEKSTRP
ncbi:MAG TPA: N-formylglutamate deformylase [Sinorhizobium sp.]|nr:N-formylglutamate deformylase [Sinorhizobium sp.]